MFGQYWKNSPLLGLIATKTRGNISGVFVYRENVGLFGRHSLNLKAKEFLMIAQNAKSQKKEYLRKLITHLLGLVICLKHET